MDRRMIWIDSDDLTGWCCSGCEWSIAAPRLDSTVAALAFNRVAQERFEKHNCTAEGLQTDAVAEAAPPPTIARATLSPFAIGTNAPRTTLDAIGAGLTRYGLAVVLLWIGALQFTAGGAASIQGLVAHSPFMSWLHGVLSVQGTSNLISSIEIAIGILIAVKFLSPRASFIGSVGAVLTFAATTTFLFSTPGVLEHGLILSDTGQFLIKDLVLLGAAIWTAADASRVIAGCPRAPAYLPLSPTIHGEA